MTDAPPEVLVPLAELAPPDERKGVRSVVHRSSCASRNRLSPEIQPGSRSETIANRRRDRISERGELRGPVEFVGPYHRAVLAAHKLRGDRPPPVEFSERARNQVACSQ